MTEQVTPKRGRPRLSPEEKERRAISVALAREQRLEMAKGRKRTPQFTPVIHVTGVRKQRRTGGVTLAA